MEEPPQSVGSSLESSSKSVSSTSVEIRARTRRRDILLREILAVLVAAAGIAMLLETAFRGNESPTEQYIGATRVTIASPLPAVDANVMFGPTSTVVYGLPFKDLTRISPADTVDTVRLGDAILRTLPNTRSAYLLAAIYDERFFIGEPEPIGTSADSPEETTAPPQTAPDGSGNSVNYFDAEKAIELAYAADSPKQSANRDLNAQKDIKRPSRVTDLGAKPAVQEPATKMQNTNNSPTQPQDTGRRARPARAAPRVLTSATMSALLRAENLGASSVGIDLEVQQDDGRQAYLALAPVIAGIQKIEPHLTRVRHINIDAPAPFDSLAAKRQLSVSKLINTPLAWPGGESFYMPHAIPAAGMPADTSSIFNAAFRTESRTTRLPAILLLVGLFGAFLLRLRSIPSDRLRFNRRGVFIGAGCVIASAAVLYGLRFMWHVGSDYIFGSLPVLTSIGLVSGIGIGAAAGWARTHFLAGDLAEERPDNALRSVLHPDKPIETIEEDRLGFRPVVDALRRFLDNPATTPPVVLSINGPWGSGKSSVMKMLRTELGKTQRFSTVWFNAWRFHKEEQILAAFLKTITSDLRRDGLSWRLAWVRLRRYSVLQYLLLLSPFVIGLAAAFGRNDGLLDTFFNWLSSTNSETTEKLVSVLGISGPILWFVRMMVPFHLQFRQLYETKDQSKRVGFLDEFAREFDLYREAVGDRKFVIFIDDLDRCPPDKIVDVLKTINLITTSGKAASTTFFVLGYDPKYITRSIDLHFKEFTRRGTAIDENFGAEYLKKMVTLSVSVPTPSPDERTQLAKRLGDAEERAPRPTLSRRDRAVLAARSVPGWFLRMAAAFSIAALLVLVAVRWHREAKVVAQEENKPATVTHTDFNPATDAQFVVSIRAARLPASETMPLWVWVIPLGLALISGGALFVRSRPTEAEIKYVRPPKDTEEFVHAVEACKDLLPENPRDVVRVLNLMRMQYLIQCIDEPQAEPNAMAGTTGNASILTEWECVSYNVLQLRHPIVFGYRFFHNKLAPALRGREPGKVSDFYKKEMEELGLSDTLVADVTCLEKTEWGVSHMGDAAKFDRYVEVNRYVLDAAGALVMHDDSEDESPDESSA